jgi:hypothetical protein
MADVANQIFLPYVQPGVAATFPDASIERLAANQPSVIAMQAQVVVNAEPLPTKTLRLYGPGDVTGVDPHQVVRTEPKPGTTDFEPNYLAAIEFDRPDLPWMFTPAKADAQGRLRPWLCLVVVRKQSGVELRPPGVLPLPVLSIQSPARPRDELPDLAESWAWAHAQVIGTDRAQIGDTLASKPAYNVSRLLCPRRLLPSTDYVACVVPAFLVGVKAGLGQAIAPAEERLDPAWLSGAQSPAQVTLPVFYAWEFRTGAGGDFEELVRRLRPRAVPKEVGKRPMDIGRPGFPLVLPPNTPPEDAVLGLEGALRVLGTGSDDWKDTTRLPFQSGLTTILNTPWQLATQPGATGDPIVAPPTYGRWHAGVHEVANTPPPAPAPPWPPTFWLDELNLDPRHRVVAGLGTQVVQRFQEPLMASAWAQIGDIQKINQRQRQAQLSRAVNDRLLDKTFRRLPEEAFLRVVAPAWSRIVLEERPPNDPNAPPTLTRLIVKIESSPVPSSVVSAPLRRMLRPRGAINRPYRQAQTLGSTEFLPIFNVPTPPPYVPDLGLTIDKISDTLPGSDPNRFNIRFVMLLPERIASANPIPSNLGVFRTLAVAHHQHLIQIFGGPIFLTTPQVIDPPVVKQLSLASVDPARAVANAVAESRDVESPPLHTDDPLEPVMDAPTFPQPMYEALRDLSQDWLLPGLEHVPPNTVQLLQTNAKFVESFMVGLNNEMARELLWRDYPTDQRGTYFRQFWDTAAAGAPIEDIPPIHEWGTHALGDNATGPGGDKIVLLVRGELLRRYPGTVIYAVRAVAPNPPNGTRTPSLDPADERHPLFRGTLEPDVTFVGFPLTPAEVAEAPGWYFVLQQQPTEPRFGLDDDPFGPGESGVVPELKTWNDLNWAHVAPDAAALKALAHVPVKALSLTPTTPQKAVWGRNAAHMASITKQRPVRVAIHASDMLPTLG